MAECKHKLTDHWVMEANGTRRFVKMCRACGQTFETQGWVNLGLWKTMSSLAMSIASALAQKGRDLFHRKGGTYDQSEHTE